MDMEKLKELSIRLGAIKNDLDMLAEGLEDEEMEDPSNPDTQEEKDPAAGKTEYTTGEGQRKSREGEKVDKKKVGLMIAFLGKRKK